MTMVDYVTKFQCILVNLFSSRRFFFFLLLLITKFINGDFSVSRDVLAFSRISSFCI